ncbi:pyruvate dehydrogenase (acetyl-transferring) E1 component subunit alpha [Candidatus Peregrinibacteria bacterium]|nr:pyruvate dehydrogenase (acetyl-transferring) E1 component subunit alpha [Candidatus Peregrinibacteria bacterium]
MPLIENFNPLTDKMFQVLDHEANVVRPELLPKWNDEKLREVYAQMLFLRLADFKLINLQRQGRCGSYISIEGQEAAQLGSGLAIEKSDWVFPAFRELGICYIHGVPLEKIALYWMGNEWGSNYEANVAPVSIPVGTHPLHAVGFAWAMKLQKKPTITISYFGDGATSEGDFYEAINFAGVMNAPTIFFCQNNQWAISVPRSKQTLAKTLAQKAIAAGIPGIQIDGNDIFAVYAATAEAAARARAGKGPTLIEAVTYRFGNHSTSDDATKYRAKDEIDYWRPRDPLVRFKLFLQKKNLWSEEWEQKIADEARGKILEAAKKAEETPRPKPDDIFDYLYAKPTPELEEQKAYLLKFL